MKFALIALLLASTVATANAATFVYRKPVSGTQCTGAACDIKTSPTAETPTEQAFDPSIVIAQARMYAKLQAGGQRANGSPGYTPAQPSATNGAEWELVGYTQLTPDRYRVITQSVNPSTGQSVYQIVAVADGSDQAREVYSNLYLPVTFKWYGSMSVSVRLAVKPEVCAAVAAAQQPDVGCSGSVVTAVFVAPEVPLYLPNAAPFAEFGGYNVGQAAAYYAATDGWLVQGHPWPYAD